MRSIGLLHSTSAFLLVVFRSSSIGMANDDFFRPWFIVIKRIEKLAAKWRMISDRLRGGLEDPPPY